MSANVIDVSAADFQSAVIDRSHEVPVVVDFWAEWCGPCKMLGPVLERLADEGAGSWQLAKVDVDQNQQLAMQFRVQGIPMVMAFKDGRPVDQFSGALPEAQVRRFIESIVPSELDLVAAQGDLAWEQGKIEAAEQAWETVLAQDPSHEEAGLGMATLLLDRGETQAAMDVLARLAPTDAVRRMSAAARLGADDTDLAELESAAEDGTSEAALALAKGLIVHGSHERALDLLVDLVGRRDDTSDEARLVMLDLFEVLGADHPLVAEYRRKLASALF